MLIQPYVADPANRMPLRRFAVRAGFVTLRQIFVHHGESTESADDARMLAAADSQRMQSLPLSRQPAGHQPFLGIAAGALSEPGTQ